MNDRGSARTYSYDGVLRKLMFGIRFVCPIQCADADPVENSNLLDTQDWIGPLLLHRDQWHLLISKYHLKYGSTINAAERR